MAGQTSSFDRMLALLSDVGKLAEAEAASSSGDDPPSPPDSEQPTPADPDISGRFLEAVNASRLAKGERPVTLHQVAHAAMAHLGMSRTERRNLLRGLTGGANSPTQEASPSRGETGSGFASRSAGSPMREA